MLLFCSLFGQQKLPLDSLKIGDAKDFFVDDYGHIYLYKNKNFSLTKLDSLGQQQGRLMLTVPFKIQNVQNPLNIVLFSENAQEIKFIDQNLNEIQKIDLRKFGFIKMAYAEDLQQIWLLDESAKRLIQYHFREDKIISSFPLNFNLDYVLDMIVFENRLYLITNKEFLVYNFKSETISSIPVENPLKLRRENDSILIISKNKIFRFIENSLKNSFQSQSAEIVDKNSSSYFEVREGKLYLYKLQENLKP